MVITLNSLINQNVSVHIEYIDMDKKTVLNKNEFTGRVLEVNPEEGISIIPDEDGTAKAVIPSAIEAWSSDDQDNYHVDWLVFRMQSKRTDGQHEWWDWQPKCISRKK